MDASTLSSMLASPLETYSLSMSSLGCNALYMVISFLVLWSICLSSSLVHLRKGPEYLTRDTAQVFITLIRFLLLSFVSSSFLVLLRYSFRIFSSISICLMVSASKMPKYSQVFVGFYYYYYYYYYLIFNFIIGFWQSLTGTLPKTSRERRF